MDVTRVADLLAPGTPQRSGLRLHSWTEGGRSVAVDYHMHTTYTDGSASVREMAEVAGARGINEILFSEHVRHTSTYYPSFVDEVRALEPSGLRIHLGVETKILDLDGNLDCPPEVAIVCDGIVGSVHSSTPDASGAPRSWSQLDPEVALELELQLGLAIVTKSQAHIIGHPMGMVVTRLKLRPLEQLYQLACACRDFDKAFELNTRYCTSPSDWIDIVKRAGCKVSFGSDAHNTGDVGSAWSLFTEPAGSTG